MRIVNFDANANHSLLPEAKQAVMAVPGDCLNPSSVHRGGQKARALIEQARDEIRLLCGAPCEWRVIFTSGATEANNLAIGGACRLLEDSRVRGTIAAASIEHPSVLGPLRFWAAHGMKVALFDPGEKGAFDPRSVVEGLPSDFRLLSLALANNETGQVLPVAEVSELVHARFPDALVHTDAVQAAGRMPLSADRLYVDLMSVSGHKLGALSGVGALLVRNGVPIAPLLHGGSQESDLRAGTENLYGIVSFGAACAAARGALEERVAKMRRRRDSLWDALRANAAPVILNKWGDQALPNTVNIRFPGVSADDLVVALDIEGVCISAGSACAAGKPEPSHVLRAMGMSPEEVRESVRLSLESHYSESDFEYGVQKIIECVSRMRAA